MLVSVEKRAEDSLFRGYFNPCTSMTPLENRFLFLSLTVFLFIILCLGIETRVDRQYAPLIFFFRCAVSAVSCLVYFRIIHIDVFGGVCLALGGVVLLSIVVNHCPLSYFVDYWMTPFAAALLSRALVRLDKAGFIRALLYASSLISLINLATVVFLQDGSLLPGLNTREFVGNKNVAIFFIIPSVFSSLLIDSVKGKVLSARSVLLYVAGLLQVVISYSSTSLVALLLVALVFPVIQAKRGRKMLSASTYLIAYSLVFIAITVIHAQEYAGFFIHDLLGKDPTFTGRTVVWGEAVRRVLETNILIGCGDDTSLYNGSGYVGSTHSMLLGFFVQGGFLGVALFLVLLGVVTRKLDKMPMVRSVALISLAIGTFYLLGLMETMRWASFYLFLGTGYSWSERF